MNKPTNQEENASNANTSLAGLIHIIKKQPLFSGLTSISLLIIAKHSKIIFLQKGDSLTTEKNNGKGIAYLILSGRMDAMSSIQAKQSFSLHEYGPQEIINLMSFFQKNSKLEQAFALTDTTLLAVDLKTLHEEETFSSCFRLLSKNIMKYMTHRLAYTEIILGKTTDLATQAIAQRLEESKVRIAYGLFLVRTFILMCLYAMTLKILDSFHIQQTFVISMVILATLCLFVLNFMQKAGLSLKEFGLTLSDWKESIKMGLKATFVLIVCVVLLKIVLLYVVKKQGIIPIIDIDFGLDKHLRIVSPLVFYSMIIYTLFVPLQEFIVRGGLQTSIYKFLTGSKAKKMWVSIIVSNLLFITFHLHVSFVFALATFLPGLVWGYVFAKHRTLVGVTLSHILFGVISIYILNIEKVFRLLM